MIFLLNAGAVATVWTVPAVVSSLKTGPMKVGRDRSKPYSRPGKTLQVAGKNSQRSVPSLRKLTSSQVDRQNENELIAGISSLGFLKDHQQNENELINGFSSLGLSKGDGENENELTMGIPSLGFSQDDRLNANGLVAGSHGVGMENACYSTWKDSIIGGSVTTATLWARREYANEPYHLDCISFHQRLKDTTLLSDLTGPFRTLIGKDDIPGFTDVRYVSKYYVNLKHFMPTQLEGDGLTCQQQLDRRIHEGLGGYLLAFNTAHEISASSMRRAFWDIDEDGTRRGVELVWSRDTGKYMI
ncbi:hypothetical protein FOZ63_029586, partial [Perkinsus olseni]